MDSKLAAQTQLYSSGSINQIPGLVGLDRDAGKRGMLARWQYIGLWLHSATEALSSYDYLIGIVIH